MYFDNGTRWVGNLEKFMFRLVGRMFSVRPDRMDVAEQEIFRSMLWRVVYEPKKRLTMNEVVDLIEDTCRQSL